jgi:AcrR family transcriptional regulator
MLAWMPSPQPQERPMSLRERKKLRTRQELADTALKLFTEHGFDAITLDQLADAVEVSKRTFFRNFTSKEDVAFAAGTELWQAVLRSAAERPLTGPVLLLLRDAMTGAVRAMDRQAGADRDPWSRRFAAMMQINRTTPALRAYGLAYCAGISRQLASVLARRLDLPGDDLTLRMLVDVAIAAWHLAADDWYRTGTGQPPAAGTLAQRLEETFAAIPSCLALSAGRTQSASTR